MDPKLNRLVTLDEGTPPTKSRDISTTWSRDKSKTLYLHFHKAYGPQTSQGGDLGWGDSIHKQSTSILWSRDK